MSSSCFISDIYFYPIKSLKGVRLNSANITDFGIENDRRFMLINSENKFLTQRTLPLLSQLNVTIDQSTHNTFDSIDISSKELGNVTFNAADFINKSCELVKVSIWSDIVDAIIVENKQTEILSNFLNEKVRLAYMPDSSFRQVDRQYFSEDQRVSFADGYPFLLTSESSLKDLNSRLANPVSMSNFRPNIVISGGISAFAEDDWTRIIVGDITFELVKPCSRCVITTIDSQGVKAENKEPLMTLSKYRKNDFGICFGQNLVHLSTGIIKEGDTVTFE